MRCAVTIAQVRQTRECRLRALTLCVDHAGCITMETTSHATYAHNHHVTACTAQPCKLCKCLRPSKRTTPPRTAPLNAAAAPGLEPRGQGEDARGVDAAG
jgi:hypothetical protein